MCNNCLEGKRGASSVFSVDVDGQGRRLASGGLDGTIRIWSVPDLLGQGEGKGPLLAAMARHTGAIMAVRWSPASGEAGGWLASGADDQVILLWRREGGGNAAMGVGGSFDFDWQGAGLNCPREQYRFVHRLTEHTRDVTDLVWSPDGLLLASCSLDGTVLVHEAASGVVRQRWEGLGFVKGLAWSPDGLLLAVQSDARELRLLPLGRSDPPTVVTWPFQEQRVHSPDDTFFRRPSWSPDGRKLAVANAFNGDQPCALILDREQPDQEHVSMIGHAQAVEVARFSPRLYLRPGGDNDPIYLLAVGSEEGTLSLWASTSTTPLVVLDGLHREGIMDIAWTPNGETLIAASYDGSMALVKLFLPNLTAMPSEACLSAVQALRLQQQERQEQTEAKLPASVAQVKREAFLHDLISGVSPPNTITSIPPPVMPASEAPPAAPAIPPPSAMASTMEQPILSGRSSIENQPSAASTQVEARTKEGRRRITPIALQTTAPAASSTPQPAAVAASAPVAILQMGGGPKAVLPGPVSQVPKAVKPEGCSWGIEWLKSSQRLVSSLGWEERLPSPPSFLLATPQLIVVICEGRCLAMSPAGRHLSPWLSLSSTIVQAQLFFGGRVLMAVLASGEFRQLELPSLKLLAKGSFAGIAPEGAQISELKAAGEAEDCNMGISFQVRFTNGSVWAWVPVSDAWVDLDESSWQLHDYSSLKVHDHEGGEEGRQLLAMVRQALKEGSGPVRQRSLSYLEHRLSLCRLLGAPNSEFNHWASLYAERLAAERGEICQERWQEFLAEWPAGEEAGRIPLDLLRRLGPQED